MRGKIDQYLPRIKQRLSLRYPVVDLMTSMADDGAEELAYKYAGKYDIIISCGGDGTLHQVVNGVIKSGENPIIGILPYGTCNDVSRTLHISHNIDKAIDSILRLNTTKYDVLTDGKDYIVYALATGYLTKVAFQTANAKKKRLGRFAYFLSALKNLFKFKKLPITIKINDERIHEKFVYFMLFNGSHVGGFHVDRSETVDNSNFKLIAIKKGKGLIAYFNLINLFLFGAKSIRKSKNAIIRDVKSIEIENHSNEPFTVDGEKIKFLKQKFEVNTQITMIKN